MERTADVAVVGAGIVGLATARALAAAAPGLRLVVLDKADTVGAEQSGHNSGVVHSGVYYRPGSHKARLCTAGRRDLEAYCRQHEIELDRCGKVIVATRTDELDALTELERRGLANGLEVAALSPAGLAEHEPHAEGLRALFVPATGVVDFGAVCRALATELRATGVELALSTRVERIDRCADHAELATTEDRWRVGRAVNCAGLQSDLLTRASGETPPARIVAFRGEYHEVVPERAFLVRHLIYPVPDPRFPFLGVHLTRGVDGTVHAGPNAVLALAREGYRWRDVSVRDLSRLGRDRATWRLAGRYWRTGLDEVRRSLSIRRTAQALARLVPELRPEDLVPAGSGVRAQAVDDDGRLLDDFAIVHHGPVLHVVNAPSPAATASLAIGHWLATELLGGSTTDRPASTG